MPLSIEERSNEVRALDADQRARLALERLESVDAGPSSDQAESAWNIEARDRLAAYDAGRATTISSEELHAG